jgi:hypothetical protein
VGTFLVFWGAKKGRDFFGVVAKKRAREIFPHATFVRQTSCDKLENWAS